MRATVLLALMLAADPAAAQRAGCADKLHVVVESGSVRRAAPADMRPDEAQLEALRAQAGARVKAIAGEMCRAGTLRRQALRGVRQIVLEQDSACAGVCVADGGPRFGGGALLVRALGGRGLRAPEAAEVERGLRAWANPNRSATNQTQPEQPNR